VNRGRFPPHGPGPRCSSRRASAPTRRMPKMPKTAIN
jgi:hypothetical protein